MIYTTSDLALDLYTLFDGLTIKQNVIQDSISGFVRLSAERPSLLGIGYNLTSHVRAVSDADVSQERAVLQASSMAEVIGADMATTSVAPSTIPQISVQQSSIKISCLDQPDKSGPPQLPDTYIYSLVLDCLDGLSDSLAKTVLPLVMGSRGKSNKTTPRTGRESMAEERPAATEQIHGRAQTDALITNSDEQSVRMKSVERLLEACWSGLLACSSTMLISSLDSVYYRNLIRTIQRFIQVSTSLSLYTPRDAFLTCLAKAAATSSRQRDDLYPAAAPPNSFESPMSAQPSAIPNVDISSISSNGNTPNRRSVEFGLQPLTQQNLMCLRALINLAIALGPFLDTAWSIIVGSLLKADILMEFAGVGSILDGENPLQSQEIHQSSMSTEVQAIRSAVRRLTAATSDFTLDSFLILMEAIRTSMHYKPSQAALKLPRTTTQASHTIAAMALFHRVAIANSSRFSDMPESRAWQFFSQSILEIVSAADLDRDTRLCAMNIVKDAAYTLLHVSTQFEIDASEAFQRRVLQWMLDCALVTRQPRAEQGATVEEALHRGALEALSTCLDHQVTDLRDGWDIIFSIIRTTLDHASEADHPKAIKKVDRFMPIPSRLLRPAFNSVQLLCEVLSSLPITCLSTLLSILHDFATQSKDLNVCLTAVNLCWDISDFLRPSLEMSYVFNLGGKNYDDTMTDLICKAEEGVTTAAWVLVQFHLKDITRDRRSELRNSAIHTIFKILENESSEMSPELFELCIEHIVVSVLAANISEQSSFNSDDAFLSEEFESSLKIILNGTSRLLADQSDMLFRLARSDEIWSMILVQLSAAVEGGSYDIKGAVFEALSKILGAVKDSSTHHSSVVQRIGSLWLQKKPQPSASSTVLETENTYVAYVVLLKDILRLHAVELSYDHVKRIIDNLKDCVVNSSPGSYTNDIDTIPPLHNEVLIIHSTINTLTPRAVSAILFGMVDLFLLSFQRRPTHITGVYTFVALSKQTVELLTTIVTSHIDMEEIYDSGAFVAVLSALSGSISERYSGHIQGREPYIWRLAGSAAIVIFQKFAAVPLVARLDHRIVLDIHTQMINLIVHLSQANWKAAAPLEILQRDEDSDLQALSELRNIITPRLGTDDVSDEARNRYLSAVFQESLLHCTTTERAALKFDAPLENLYKIRIGRTFDPPINPRIGMCYYCLDELFDLARLRVDEDMPAAPDLSGNRGKLQRAAMPLLILRCALPLKMYIADQTLRGNMPTPMSQRLELLHIMEKITQFESHVATLSKGTPPDYVSQHDLGRGLLGWLAPLIHKAVGQVKQDSKLLDAMQMIMTNLWESTEKDCS